jgi:ribonuclease P protein component
MSTLHASSAGKKASAGVPHRFSSASRLLKHADFQTVYQQGRKHFSGNMVAFYHRSGRSDRARVGLTVGRVLGGAVERNRIRRRMRAAVGRHLTELVKPVDLVLHPRKSVLTMKFSELEGEIAQVFAAVQRGKG